MTIRPNYESRMPELLRNAPYLDLEELRAEMVGHAQRILDQRDIFSDRHMRQLESFVSGDGHTLPSRFGLTDRLYSIVRRMQRQHRPDSTLDEAYHACVRYFFHVDLS